MRWSVPGARRRERRRGAPRSEHQRLMCEEQRAERVRLAGMTLGVRLRLGRSRGDRVNVRRGDGRFIRDGRANRRRRRRRRAEIACRSVRHRAVLRTRGRSTSRGGRAVSGGCARSVRSGRRLRAGRAARTGGARCARRGTGSRATARLRRARTHGGGEQQQRDQHAKGFHGGKPSPRPEPPQGRARTASPRHAKLTRA
jgi:hypothetical protein